MKNTVKSALLIIAIALIALFVYSVNLNISYRDKLRVYDNNFKALTLENNTLKNDAIAYRFNIEQLEYINDSIAEVLNTTRKELKIKDKNIEQMQYMLSEGNIKDSIVFRDTIFKRDFTPIDTTVGDNWYKLTLKATSSNTLSYNIIYKSELNVLMHKSKEYMGVPKKCCILRLFQKKYTLTRVTVIDNNPYAEIKDKKFYFID